MPDGSLVPQSERDRDLLFSKYKKNQLVSIQVTGGESARSIPELNLWYACMKIVAEDNDCIDGDQEWDTVWKVKMQAKMALKFFAQDEKGAICIWLEDGGECFKEGSLEFTKATQARSHAFIKEAIPYIASKIGLDAETLVNRAKSRMKRR